AESGEAALAAPIRPAQARPPAPARDQGGVPGLAQVRDARRSPLRGGCRAGPQARLRRRRALLDAGGQRAHQPRHRADGCAQVQDVSRVREIDGSVVLPSCRSSTRAKGTRVEAELLRQPLDRFAMETALAGGPAQVALATL